MAPFDKSKRSLVKHRTHKPFNGPGERSGGQSRDDGTKMKGARGGRGFQVGPRHAPDGAYLGKAKKIKANLIANAKTKKQFYKSMKEQRQQDISHTGSNSTPDLGRFAPEKQEEVDVGPSRRRQRPDDYAASQRRRDRAGPAMESDDETLVPGSRRGARSSGKQNERSVPAEPASLPIPPPKKRRYESKEEAMAARAERHEKWSRTSRSAQGQKRGQPDLGARMEVLLGRIQDAQ